MTKYSGGPNGKDRPVSTHELLRQATVCVAVKSEMDAAFASGLFGQRSSPD